MISHSFRIIDIQGCVQCGNSTCQSLSNPTRAIDLATVAITILCVRVWEGRIVLCSWTLTGKRHDTIILNSGARILTPHRRWGGYQSKSCMGNVTDSPFPVSVISVECNKLTWLSTYVQSDQVTEMTMTQGETQTHDPTNGLLC